MSFRPLKLLIGCEKSGQLRRAFRALGHEAWSCDREPADDASEFHIQGDAVAAIRRGYSARFRADIGKARAWDAIICHPPCTRLCNSGVLRLYVGGKKAGGIDPDKWNAMTEGARFFRECWDACGDIPRAFENPTMHGYASALIGLGTGAQAVQPYEFGDDASKRTVFWLQGLPKVRCLDHEQWAKPRHVCPKCSNKYAPGIGDNWRDGAGFVTCNRCGTHMLSRWANQTDSGQNRLGPSETRAAERAETYPGIARAMAAQWSEYLLK